MDCPECGTTNTRVLDTFKGQVTRRRRQCPCGVTFSTTEVVDKGSVRSLPVPISRNIPTRVADQSPPIPTERRESFEITTLFPGSDPIRSGSGPLSDLRLDLSQEVDRAKEYESEFLAFWDVIEPIGRRKGDKAEAQKVWRKKRRPNSANLISAWLRYRTSCGEGYTMDADRWLRNDGWLKEWEPAPKEKTTEVYSPYGKLKDIAPGVAPPPRPRP